MLEPLKDKNFMKQVITAAFGIGRYYGAEEAVKAFNYFMENYGKAGLKIPKGLDDIIIDGMSWNKPVYGMLTIDLRGCEINGNKICKQDDDRIEEQRRGSWRSQLRAERRES